jgi:hypothetical protein
MIVENTSFWNEIFINFVGYRSRRKSVFQEDMIFYHHHPQTKTEKNESG